MAPEDDRSSATSAASSRSHARAVAALRAGDFGSARSILQECMSTGYGDAETHRLLALTEHRLGNLAQAVLYARKSVTGAPGNALAWHELAVIFDARNEWKDALQAFRAACELCPTSLKMWANWGKTLIERGQSAEAVRVLTHALTLGEHKASRIRLARALVSIGRTRDAEQELRAHLLKYRTDGEAWFALASLGDNVLSDADGNILRQLVAEPTGIADDDIAIQFAFSRFAEQRNDFATAFKALLIANAAERLRVQWNGAVFSEFASAVVSAFNRPSLSAPSDLGRGIIFILGLPRTGSSLVEQVIGQGTDVAAGGELPLLSEILQQESQRRGTAFPHWVADATAQDWRRLGEQYLAGIADRRGAAIAFTDKRCGNWVYIGAIAHMLPAARIVYTYRAPVDTCFGCFRQLFAHGAQPFSYDISECAAYWHDCTNAMAAWQHIFGNRIRFQEHESLLAQPAEQLADLGEFCQLPLSSELTPFLNADIATASAAQLRSKRTIARSWNALYGDQLEPIRRDLQCLSGSSDDRCLASSQSSMR